MVLKEGGKISAQSKSVLQLDRILSGNGFACFHELIKTSQLYASDLCYAGTLPVAIFCSKVDQCAEGILCDGWMRLAVDKRGVAAILAVRAAAKRCLDRHVCGVGIGSKSAEVDLEGVLNALRIGCGTSLGGYAGGGERYADDASMSSASTVQQTQVLQYCSAATAFRRELDRAGGYDRGGRGGGGGRGPGSSHYQERGGGPGFRDRDREFRDRNQRGGGGFGGGQGGDRYSDRGGESDRDWRGMRDGAPRGGKHSDNGSGAGWSERAEDRRPHSRTASDRHSPLGGGRGGAFEMPARNPDGGGSCMRDARLDDLSKGRQDSSSLAPSGLPGAGKYVPPSRRIL